MATLLDCPLRHLPTDEALVRIFSVIHILYVQGESEAVLREGVERTSRGLPSHPRRPWEDRLRSLGRWVRIERRTPSVTNYSTRAWYRGDLIDTLNSEVFLIPTELELLRSEAPELHSYALRQKTIDQVFEGVE